MSAPSTETSVLIVDDDEDLRGLVALSLSRHGIGAVEAEDSAAMWRALDGGGIDAILLDVRLGPEDGFAVLRELRQTSRLPVIMLTGMDSVIDRVIGLESGADDYIGKPFEPRELIARVRSVLRRSTGLRETAVAEPAEILAFAGWRLDITHRRLASADGEEVRLTQAEFAILQALALAPNRPLTRDQLLEASQGRAWEPFDRSVDVLVSRIRRKMGDCPIRSVRGTGYALAAHVRRSVVEGGSISGGP